MEALRASVAAVERRSRTRGKKKAAPRKRAAASK